MEGYRVVFPAVKTNCPECKALGKIINYIHFLDGDKSYHETQLICNQRHLWAVKTKEPIAKFVGYFDETGAKITD